MVSELMYLSCGGVSLDRAMDMTIQQAQSFQAKLIGIKQAELQMTSPLHLLRILGLVRGN
jgi:hypothetical protein